MPRCMAGNSISRAVYQHVRIGAGYRCSMGRYVSALKTIVTPGIVPVSGLVNQDTAILYSSCGSARFGAEAHSAPAGFAGGRLLYANARRICNVIIASLFFDTARTKIKVASETMRRL